MANISIQEKINKLRSVVGISVSEGLVYCGDPASLVKFLTTFQNNLNEMMKEIRQALDKNDLDYFVIKVHALKTTARMIGAQGLSEFALSLENAGRKKDRMYIDRNIQQLFEMTADYRDRLDFLAKQGEDEAAQKIPKQADFGPLARRQGFLYLLRYNRLHGGRIVYCEGVVDCLVLVHVAVPVFDDPDRVAGELFADMDGVADDRGVHPLDGHVLGAHALDDSGRAAGEKDRKYESCAFHS